MYFIKGKFLTRNTTAKIVSIAFALVLWLYVMGEVNPETTIQFSDIDVQLLNEETVKQSGLVVIGEKDFSVNVKIHGRRNDLYRIKSDDIIASVDLQECWKGKNNVPVDIKAPAYVDVEDVSPKQIQITLDRVIKRKKSVVIRPIGAAAEGFEAGEATVFPKEVMVEGPETFVNKVAKVAADVNVSDKSGKIADRAPLYPVDKRGKKVSGVKVEKKYAEIILPMYKIKEVPISVTLKGEPKENAKVVRIETKPDRVLIKGPKELVEGISEIKTADINLDGFDKSITKKIQLLLPEGVKAPYLNKGPEVTVVIEKNKMKEFVFNHDEIAIKNLANGYTADLKDLPDVIQVQVFAAESIANNLEKKDIQLYINAKELPTGSYSENILYSITHEVEKVRILPDKVTIEIKDTKNGQNTTVQ
jgi:YbbR domain-containing protein